MRFVLPAVAWLLAAAISPAQDPTLPFNVGGLPPKSFEDVATLEYSISPAKAKPGEVVTIKFSVTPKPFCWTYPVGPEPDQASKSFLKLPPPGDLIFLNQIVDPPGLKKKKGALPGEVMQVYFDAASWEVRAVVSPRATPGKKSIEMKGVRFQACNEQGCLYAGIDPFVVEVLPGPADPVPPEFQKVVDAALNPTAAPAAKPVESSKKEDAPAGIVKKAYVPFEQHKAALENLFANLETQKPERKGGLWALLITAAIWGLVSLVTPCVFPMIPITVSLFLKQSHQSATGAVKLAAVYSLTIVLVLGLSAITLLATFREWSVSPWMNLGLGVLFVVLALSLFGMFDLTLPGFMLRYAEVRRKSGGLLGAVFGAIAFSIVSFTCVAPFLGGFAGMASSGQYTQFELILAGFAFAAAFASPFFVLAVFPSLIKMLPKSGGWLETVKVVMGFLEVAAAVKFFRTAELRILEKPAYFTYEFSLAAIAVVLIGCGLYLFNLIRLPHDEEKSHISVPRLLFALLFIVLGIYLLPGTLKGQRPGGVVYDWVDSFILPAEEGEGADFPWRSDLPAAIEHARKTNTLVFADFTGVTCTNCKKNERSVFPQKNVRDLLKKYTLVQMYTDEVPAAFYTTPPRGEDRDREALEGNLWFQRKAFGTEQLPLYVIFEPQPNGKVRVVGVYDEGTIQHPDRFEAFLRAPLEGR